MMPCYGNPRLYGWNTAHRNRWKPRSRPAVPSSAECRGGNKRRITFALLSGQVDRARNARFSW